MGVGALFWAGLSWWSATMGIQWLSAGLARRRRPAAPVRHRAADFSLVAPMVGRRDASEAYVRALERLADAGAEILICVTSEDDEAVPAVRAHWPQAPILVGSDDTFNPKLNNVRKGFEAASRPVVMLCDAGVAVTEADLAAASALLSERVGLVLALKVGTMPGNFAGAMECAYINGHQARFLLAADRLGMPVASGGVTILSREVLHKVGGHRGFLNYLADDYSIVRTVRDQAGLTTWLANVTPGMPVGRRTWRDVWHRQVRWGSTRLKLSPEVRALVLFEPVIGWLVSGIALAVALAAAGTAVPWIFAALLGHSVAWLAAEGWFLSRYRLPGGPVAWAAALAREILVPWLAFEAWRGRNRIDWRGTDLAAGWQPGGDSPAGKRV